MFGAAAIVALKFQLTGLGMCCCCLIVYIKPEAPGAAPPSAPGSKPATS
jgi:hypothetical protein